jgi:hypothetical protein
MLRFFLHTVLASFLILSALMPAVASAKQTKGAGTSLLPAKDAYSQVVGWAMGYGGTPTVKTQLNGCTEVCDRVERAAYRYSIIPEFALAVVCAEASYGTRISYARKSSWQMYEKETGQRLSAYPAVFDDLSTSLSELAYIMEHSATVEDVLNEYWCGPQGSINQDSHKQFVEAACKLYNGLKPYADARKQSEDRSKYKSQYSDSAWDPPASYGSTVDSGSLKGYQSKLGGGPLKSARRYAGHEDAYAKKIREINKRISAEDAKYIANSILSYCELTDWQVDPRFIMALVAAESAFRPQAVSRVGAMGLGQLMPGTARSLGVTKPFDPLQNLYGCVKYVEREQFRWRNSGDAGNIRALVLASYNAGPGAVQKYNGVPPYKETKSYVKTVEKYYRKFVQGS